MQTELPEDARSVEAIRRLMTELCKALSALAEGVAKAAPDAVRELLVRRADVLPSIDERLVKVADLIRRGLRDEAIGYAVEPPGLVDAATLLDLSSNPRWGQWLAAITEQIIPEPAMPRMDLVATLVKAQDDVVRFKPMLDTWRRMNLANSPLRDRITMLRKFREVDPANELWFEALREHQKQRLMELEREIREATAQHDELRLAAIVEEPLATTSLVPMHYLAQLAGGSVKAVLSGQGADEPLGGYGRYQGELCRRFVPSWAARMALPLARSVGIQYEQVLRGLESMRETSPKKSVSSAVSLRPRFSAFSAFRSTSINPFPASCIL